MLNIKSKIIVAKIVEDMANRAGLDNAWNLLDEKIRKRIMNEWSKIVAKELNK